MTLSWYERVPKASDRDKLLARMGEGTYLGILRKAALRQYKDVKDKVAALQQTALAELIGTKPQTLRDMESGHRAAPLKVCKVYCSVMGLPVTVLKRAGSGKLVWDGDTPSDPKAATFVAPLPKARAEKSEEEKERTRKLRAEDRVINGPEQTSIDVSKITGIRLRNHTEWNHVVELSLSSKGTLVINIFDEGPESSPAGLLKAGFTGVRIAIPQTVVYDYDQKKKVTDIVVATDAAEED